MGDAEKPMDLREHHIRWLALLMTKRGIESPEVVQFLANREYGLALQSLAAEIKDEQ